MFRFIQALEGRRLFTATTGSLAAELATIAASGGTVSADLATLQSTVKTDNKAIATDLKGASKTGLLAARKFSVDQSVLLKKIKTDEGALFKSVAASSRGAADGDAVIADPGSASLGAKIQAVVTALASVASTPDGKLMTDSSDAGVDADLAALTAANPTIPALATADAAAKSHLDTLIAKLVSDAGTLTNNVSAIRVDLTTLLPQPTTSPSLVGDYQGTIKTKAIAFGLGSKTLDMELICTAQTINTLTGSITIDNNSASGTITVVELSNGKVTFKINSTDLTLSLAGTVNVSTTAKGLPPGSVISGSGTATVDGFNVSGSFIMTKVT